MKSPVDQWLRMNRCPCVRSIAQSKATSPHRCVRTLTQRRALKPMRVNAETVNRTVENDLPSSQTSSNIIYTRSNEPSTIGSILEGLNTLSSKAGTQSRYHHLLRLMISAVSTANADNLSELVDQLTAIYTDDLPAVDRSHQPTNRYCLEARGLHPIALPKSTQLILRTISFIIYRNPTRHKEVAANIIAEWSSNQ